MLAERFDRITPPLAPTSPGLHVDEEGRGTFAVAAPRAESVDLCVRRGGAEHRTRLRHYDGGLHWDHVSGMVPGTAYGLRVSGPWDPDHGMYANPAKLLLDPMAHGVTHASPLRRSFFPLEVDDRFAPLGSRPRRCMIDDGPEAVWSVVTEDRFDWDGEQRPRIDWDGTVLYELHVKGFTRVHPLVPEELRGTYAGLAHPAVIEHLLSLGVTSVELLPIHAAMDEPHLARLGLTNYWGYSTLSFNAPNPAYATAAAQRAGAQAVLDEVKSMVRALHGAGIEVLLDVVYNHTAEGGAYGPSLSLRGLDAVEYFRHEQGRLADVTGTGATLDAGSVHVQNLVLDSLRWWAQEVRVDGFRFDLATTLGRDQHGFRPDHPLLRGIATDPLLRERKLIAEPWDVGPGGWQTGAFPPPFAEWNDAFRDDVRRFWLADRGERARTGRADIGGVRDLATRLAGSSDLLTSRDPEALPAGRSLRSPWASVNFATAHDGFTLHDLTTYDRKHNRANGEDGRDGTDANRSWNHGREGDAPGPDGGALRAARGRTARAILATLLLASGTPMLTAGDEMGRTQHGNNNAYCQDNEISWVDWSAQDPSLLRCVRQLTALRRTYPQLRSAHFLQPADPSTLDPGQVAWFGADGTVLGHADWMNPEQHVLAMLRPGIPGVGDCAHLLVVMSADDQPRDVALPSAPWPTGPARILFDSAPADATDPVRAHLAGRTLRIVPGSAVVLGIGEPEPLG